MSLIRRHDELGLVTTCGPAPRLSRTPVNSGYAAPKPGKHAPEILAEAGLGDSFRGSAAEGSHPDGRGGGGLSFNAVASPVVSAGAGTTGT